MEDEYLTDYITDHVKSVDCGLKISLRDETARELTPNA